MTHSLRDHQLRPGRLTPSETISLDPDDSPSGNKGSSLYYRYEDCARMTTYIIMVMTMLGRESVCVRERDTIE
jgi:hypothetical protein